MNIEKILTIFCRLSGLSSHNAAELYFLCDSSAELMLSRLKKNIDWHRCQARVEFAVAVLAYRRYLMTELADSAGTLRVGDISVKSDGAALRAADALWQETLDGLADLLEDRDFVFEGIRL